MIKVQIIDQFAVLYEAVSLDGNTLRRCVVVGWRELLGRDLQTLFDQAVGGVIIIIPADLDALSPAHRAVSIVSSSLCEPVIVVFIGGGIEERGGEGDLLSNKHFRADGLVLGYDFVGAQIESKINISNTMASAMLSRL